MCEVEFEPVEPGCECSSGGSDEIELNSADIIGCHRRGYFGEVSTEGLWRGGDGGPAAFVLTEVSVAFPGPSGAALAAGVSELDAGGSTVGFDKAGDSGIGFDMVIEVEAGALGADAAFR